MNDKLNQPVGVAGIVAGLRDVQAYQTPKPKKTIYIKEVENGWTIHYNTSNYAGGEEIRVAKSFNEVLQVLQDIAMANKLE